MIDTTIGNYRITGELAQGGMGSVYRGRHVSLPREVVVKSINLASFPAQHQGPLKARFLREAYIQSQLDHPNIVRVYEFFTPAENYYLVMEFIEGMSLRDLIRRQGALDPTHAVGLLRQALSALDYAHNFSYLDESSKRLKGIVHRDIKPANLLLDGMARLKITDFGIVKFQGDTGMTRAGFNPGTLEYMSPEQIRGYEVDARSDLYSLGVTFYEALTGRLPFPPSETGSDYEVARGHIEQTPPPIASLKPDIPADLAGVIMRALEKKPEERYQSAADFLEALNRYERNGKPVTHSMTELITDTRPIPPAQETNSPVPSIETNIIPKSEPAPIEKQASGGRTGLFTAIGLVALLIAVSAGYFAFRGAGEPAAEPAASVPDQQPAAAHAPVEDAHIRQARSLEDQELYADAIRQYEEFMKNNPGSPDTARLTEHSAALKKIQGLLTIAEIELGQNDLEAARRDFAEALRLRPQSARARKGVEDVEKRLAAKN